MKLIQATIYGFGKWMDYTIDFSDGVCIYGENESGKSTIQKFILFMLFGMPPKQREFYRPKTGGKMGGQLTIYDPDEGNYTIERLDQTRNGAAICYTSDGKEYDEKWLKDRLEGMTLQTYQSIFSFSALDLSRITTMKEEDLGEVLLSIGLSGSTEIYNFEKQLEKQIGELFKPYGKKPIINQQLDILDERFACLQDFKANEATYREKKNNEAALYTKRSQLQEELKKEKSNDMKNEKHIQALPVLQDYRIQHSRLLEYGDDFSFPENGLTRLENIKSELLPLQSELAFLKDNEQKYLKKIDELKEEMIEQPVYDVAYELIQEKKQYLDFKKELERTENMLAKKKIEIETEIDRLNVEITMEGIAHISFPFHLEKTWIGLKNELEQLQLEKDRSLSEEQQLKQERNYLFNQIEELKQHVLPDDEVLELKEKVNHHNEYHLAQKLQKEANQKRNDWKTKKIKKQKQIATLFAMSMIVAAIAAIGAVFTDLTGFFHVMIIFLVFGVVQGFLGNRSLKDMDKWVVSEQFRVSSTEVTKEEKQDIEQQLVNHNKRLNKIENIEEKLNRNEMKRLNHSEKKQTLDAKKNRIDSQLEVHYNHYPFLRDVEVRYWPELYHALKQLLSEYQQYEDIVSLKKDLNGKINKYQSQVNLFLMENQVERSEHVNHQYEQLDKLVLHQQDLHRNVEHYRELLGENKESQQQLLLRIQTYVDEKNSLFQIAKVETEESFYEKSSQLQDMLQTKESLEKSIRQLDRLFPEDSWRDLVAYGKDETVLTWQLDDTKENVKKLEKEIEEIHKQIAQLEVDLNNMETSESYSRSLHLFEMEHAQLNKVAKEWAIMKTAKEILTDTKKKYREKYLSKVIEVTSNYFQQLTGNNYIKVYPPMENKGFQVETENGLRYTVNELSKGTIDQLYISLRLAISQTMSEKHRVPFIIDDAFIHFDKVRTERMMRMIEQISEEQQILLFTCKSEVIENKEKLDLIFLENPVRIN